MKRRAKLLLEKSIDSLLLAIDHFNRPWNTGRQEAVLIFLDRAFELLLKASIVERGGRIREPGAKETIGFDKCVRKCYSDAELAIIGEDQALTLQMINSLRDAAQHYILDISEEQLYIYSQAGVTVFADILEDVFKVTLSDYLPGRVFPITTLPPKDLHTIFEAEFEKIRDLVRPGSRKRVDAHAKLRGLAIVESSLAGIRSQPGDYALRKLVKQIQEGKKWSELFPGVASLRLDTEKNDFSVSIRLTKKQGEAVQLVPEGTPGAMVVAVKRVNELGFYSMGLHDLAKKAGLTAPKTLAMVRYLNLQDSDDYFKVISIGNSKHKRYSQKAIDAIRNELPDVNLDEVWRAHGSRRGKQRR